MQNIEQIFRFSKVDKLISTSGQPKIDEFQYIKENGFEIVINIRSTDEMRFLFNEKKIVEDLGLKYFNIDMTLENPSQNCFDEFCHIMDQFSDIKKYVHCKANKRVSAFLTTYLRLKNKMNEEEAYKFMHQFWEPSPKWIDFINSQFK